MLRKFMAHGHSMQDGVNLRIYLLFLVRRLNYDFYYVESVSFNLCLAPTLYLGILKHSAKLTQHQA